MTLSPWEKIMRAAKRGTGLRLTADEVWMLRMDSSIEQVAINEAEKREQEKAVNGVAR